VPITLHWNASPNADPNHVSRTRYWVYLFARLKPGVSIEQAAGAINPRFRAIVNDVEAPQLKGYSEQGLAAFRAQTLRLEPGRRGQSNIRTNARTPLTVLILATTLVLLIACVNVATLMLVRASGRAGEIAVRTSLGASSPRIVGLLLAEVLLLAVLAALVSVPLAVGALAAVGTMLPGYAAATFTFRLDSTMLGITAALALISAACFGVAPIFKLARLTPGRMLRTEGARATVGKVRARFRAALTVTQVALSMALLVLAGWFAQSLANAARVDLGFHTESLVTFGVAPERSGYTPERASALFGRLEEELAGLPGVTSVASSAVPVLTGTNWNNNVAIEDLETGPDVDANVATNYVSTGFLSTLEIPLLAGRDFTAADAADRSKVAIVNERFLEKFGLDRHVVGKRMSFGRGGPLDIEIVGIVRDAKYSEVKANAPPQVLVPRVQLRFSESVSFYVRSNLEPLAVREGIQQVLRRLDPSLPLTDLRTVRDVVSENLFVDRFMSTLAAALAALATLLASLGLYAVLSYGVAQRTRELGLRLALGAPPHRLRGMVLRQVAWMAAIGGALGLAAALLLGRAARSLLFELSPTDPAVPASAMLALGAVVLAAGYLPARRASRIDPVVALRSE
jgi:predicted permease